MRVVLDSNILFSALISRDGSPNRIYEAWRNKQFELVTAVAQLDELRPASRYAKCRGLLRPHQVGRLLNDLRSSLVLDQLPGGYETADPDDAWLLALAETGKADHLVTGDKRSGLLARRRIGTAGILTATAFCQMLG